MSVARPESEDVEVDVKIRMPKELLESFCLVVQGFEKRDPARIHVAILANAPTASKEEAMDLFRKMNLPYGVATGTEYFSRVGPVIKG